jgi:hypothetical protein
MSIKNISGGLKGGRRMRLTTLPSSVRRLSREYGSLDVSQPVTCIAFPSRFLLSIRILNTTILFREPRSAAIRSSGCARSVILSPHFCLLFKC